MNKMYNIQLSKYDSSGVSESWLPPSVMATIIPIQMADGERSPSFRRIAFYGGELLVVGLLELGLEVYLNCNVDYIFEGFDVDRPPMVEASYTNERCRQS